MQTILLLEDDPISLRVLGTVLREKGGYHLLEANAPEQAVEICRAQQGPIDLLVADVILRSASGPEVMARLSESQPGMKVLFISGSDPGDLIAKGLLRRGDPFLMKPFTVARFLDAVQNVLQRQPGTAGR